MSHFRYRRCDSLIGIPVAEDRVDQILERFGLNKAIGTTAEEPSWKIPSYRPDLQREADLIEEVVRVFGIDRVPVSDRSRFTPESEADRIHDIGSVVRQRLVGKGLSEARTSALIPRQTRLPGISGLQLRNPLSEDHVALRPTLLLGLLDVLERNVRAGAPSIRLFELGHVFSSENAAQTRKVAVVLLREHRKQTTLAFHFPTTRSV